MSVCAGDILGRALQNLDRLLQMPYGCGEQNIALLASDVYILQYLKDTQQLTPDITAKSTSFLTNGDSLVYSLHLMKVKHEAEVVKSKHPSCSNLNVHH